MDALPFHRFQFAFTIVYHYLFPQLTMGLAVLIVIFKALALKNNDEGYHRAARFWIRIFGINFVMGVVTGIPMEFQFGTNWGRFSEAAGGIIGQTLAMEGVFAFFLESAFLYLLLFQEERLGPKGHFAAACLVALGTWLSGYFIVCTNAFMQHPHGHEVLADGSIRLVSLVDYLTNPWGLVQYAHTMMGTLVTGSFVVTGVGALYLLLGRNHESAQRFLRVGLLTGAAASLAVAFPTGDLQSKLVAKHQPITFAAMEGHFHTETGAGLAVLGQPNLDTMTLDNPIVLPRLLSIMTHQRWDTTIKGLVEYPRDQWPDNVPLLYYVYHIMVGLGTMFIALTAGAVLWRKFRKTTPRLMLWALMLATPFPYIANTAGWMTAELGRQPWLLYGLMRTADGSSQQVSSGSILFSLLGFMGLYSLLSLLFVLLVTRVIVQGPDHEVSHA